MTGFELFALFVILVVILVGITIVIGQLDFLIRSRSGSSPEKKGN